MPSGSARTIMFVAAWLLGGSVSAQAPVAVPSGMPDVGTPPVIKAIRAGAYWVAGPIANSGFVVGDKGVIVIDAQTFVPVAKAVLGEIARLTPKPVDTVILTHSDPDHINGLPAFPRGVAVYAQNHAAADIERVVADPKSNGLSPLPAISDYVPTHRIDATETLTIDGVRLVMIHTGPAHTNGDLIVYLPAERLVYAGDLLTPAIGPYPGIHLGKHGSSAGWIASVKAMLALDATLFVSGHGEPLTREEVRVRLAAAATRRGEIEAMIAKRMTLAEIRTALHDAPLPGPAARFPTFVETVYQELAGAPS